jgi:hypothetical protein
MRIEELYINTIFDLSLIFLFIIQITMARRPVDLEEELRLMAQEVRGYVEAVLNSLAANVPKVRHTCG